MIKPGSTVRTPSGLYAVVESVRRDGRLNCQYVGKTPTDGLHGNQRPQDCRQVVLPQTLVVEVLCA